ncbi:unnamed protein product [Porites evermanni]|uniref:Uncharacterized protein n=1 Tax=Porites evermanni TaxID=104178 RepID=A0ABN8PH77_9CNID|nr:unnamed protein product [Porites evermanni]
MIKSSLARSIGAPITKSSQQALQADGLTPLAVVSETRLILFRADKHLALDALVVDDLDVDVLAGTPFLIANEISVRPAKCQVLRLVNSSQETKLIGRHKHLSQILPTEETSSFTSTPSLSSLPQPVKPKSSLPFSSSVSIDPDNILPEDLRVKFRQLLQTYGRFFDPDITGYNVGASPFLASMNIGPYSRNQLVELQAKFDELEQAQVFRLPEDLGITIEYLNPSVATDS